MSDTPPSTEVETLGSYLRATRTAVRPKLTQAMLAGRLGVTQPAVQAWEADESIPSPRALHFLAEQLPGLDPAKLLALIPSGSR